MSRLIDKIKADANDERPAAEITYDIGQQLEAAGNKEVFAQNPDFYSEYIEIKDSLRRPLGQEVYAALSASLRDSVPESLYNAGAATYSMMKGPGGPLLDKLWGNTMIDFLHRKAQQEKDEYEVHRGEVSVPGIENINDVGDLGRFAATQTAETIPQMLPMLLGGGAAAARGASTLARLGAAALPAIAQQTGEIYGNMPDEVKGTPIAGTAASLGGVVAGALDVGGMFAGPIGKLIRKAAPQERALLESIISKIGAERLYQATHDILNRGGWKGAAANALEGALFEGPTELAQEAISIAAEEYATGKKLPKDVVKSRLSNSAAGGSVVGAILGGGVGLKKGPQRVDVNKLEPFEAERGVADPRMMAVTPQPMDFGDLPLTEQEHEQIYGPPLREEYPLKPDPLSPEEYQALYGVLEPNGPMQFQSDDDIDLESFANTALNAATGAAKLSEPLLKEVDFEAETYVPPKKKLPGEIPNIPGPPAGLPDKYDITKPLLGPGNELYAADAPSPMNFDQGMFEARRAPEYIRTPEEVAADLFAYNEAKRSTQRVFKSKKPAPAPTPAPVQATSGIADEIRKARENIEESKKLKGPDEPIIARAPTLTPDARIENGPPLVGRIYVPEDGGNDAKIATASTGGRSNKNQTGSRKAVALLDRATGQVLVRDVKNRSAKLEGKRVAAEMVGGMQIVRNRKPVIDPVYATMAAPWDSIKKELYRGVPRFDVIGEFYFDDERSSINFNFNTLAEFEAHSQIKEALNNYQTRGVGAAPEIQERISRLFPRDTEKFATRADIEKAISAEIADIELTKGTGLAVEKVKKLQKKKFDMLIAHKHKLTKEELDYAKRTFSPKEYANLEVASKNIKQQRRKQAVEGGGSVDLQHSVHDTEAAEVVANVSDEAKTPREAAEEAEISASTANVPDLLKKLAVMVKDPNATQAEIEELAAKFAMPRIKLKFPKYKKAELEAATKMALPAMIEQIKKHGTSVMKSMRAPSAWQMTPGQAVHAMGRFLRAMQAQGVDVVGIQADIDSAYEAVAKKHAFVLDQGEKGRAIVAMVANWVNQSQPDTNTVLNAAHEAAHVFMQQSGMLSPEIQSAFQSVISELPWQDQNFIIGPYVTDLRLLVNSPREFLNADQQAILDRATMQEIQEALSIGPTERIIEHAVEHLALFGVEQKDSRGIIQQVIRFIKDLGLQIAIAIQKRIKPGSTNTDLVKAFVENRWLQFINRDFAASNSSIWTSLREWIGAPTVIAERLPIYQNIDGEPTNMVWNPANGEIGYVPPTSDSVDSVADRIKLALDRYNAERDISPTDKLDDSLVSQLSAMMEQYNKLPEGTPEKRELGRAIARLNSVYQSLGFSVNDRNRVLRRAKAAGEPVQFSQRQSAGEALGDEGPTIEANTTLATINYELQMFESLHKHPDVIRYLPVGTTMEEFLTDYVQLTPSRDPLKKKAKAIETISSGRDAYGQPFEHNPGATITDLPTSVNGSSAQQAAIRDALINLNKTKELLQRRSEQATERLAELTERKENLTTSEKREFEKLNARIPMYERIAVLKDVGIDDQISRLEAKIGRSMLWDATPGAVYLVPPAPDSGEDAVRSSSARIPASMAFDNASRQAFYQNVRAQTEWLNNEENRNLGSIYGEVQIQNRKLLALSAEPIYTAQTWRLRNTYFDSLRNMLRGIGTPLAKYVGSRFDKLDAILLRWGNNRQISGTKWSRAYEDFKESVNWKASDEDFRRRYWNRIVAYAEDIPDGTTDPAGAVIRAMAELSKFKLSADAKSKLRILLRATAENNAQEVEILKSELLKVEDEELGKHAQRDIVRQGFITGRRTTSEQIDRIYQEMRPVWHSTDDVDFFGDLSERYSESPESVEVEARAYFTPTILSSFVKPFIYHNRQYIKAPAQEGGVVRMASLANVREAFEACDGNMVLFARLLNELEGGSPANDADYIQSTLSVFRDKFHQIQSIYNKRKQTEAAGVEVLPRQIMDAREASDLPPDFVNYATYDASANRTLLFQLALNSAFGRNGLSTGEFIKNVHEIETELDVLHTQLSNLVEVEGRSKEEAKNIMGDEKYYIALQARDHLQLLGRITDKVAMVTRSSGSLMADIRLLDELVAFNANMILQQPTAALTNTLDVLAPFYRLKLSSQAFSAMKNDIKTVARDVFGSLMEAMGVRMLTEAETAVRMRKLGLNDSELYLSYQDKVADYGPGGALDKPSGVETIGHKVKRNSLLAVRRARQITNLGVAEIADLATLRKFGVAPGAMKPGDKNIAPKFRVLGIFNTVGQALANGAIDGQYRNFKDMVTRGLEFIKSSANPDAVANNLLDGKIKLTAENLGYNRKWFVLNDKAAFDYMTNAIAEKLSEGSLERMVADAYVRMKKDPKAEVITDKQFVGIANLALTEFQLNSNFSNAPIDIKAGGGLWRILSPFLSWPYYAMLRVPSVFKDQNNQWRMKAAVDGVAVSMMAIVPLTMAASMMFDWFDENIVGKRRNLRQANLEDAIPGYGVVTAPMATLERLGRYGAGGLLTEAVNSALNVDDARGGLTADNRILLFSQMKNFKDIVGNLWQEGPQNANYASVIRPFAQFIGLGGILQYQQIANKALGLKNEEAAVNNRINIANYLRASGRDLDLDVRVSRGPSSLPNEVTPYLQNMELAAYMDDINMFRDSYRRAVTAYHQLHPDEPDAARQVIRSFQTRHPLKRVFATLPSERNYRNVLDNLNPTGREAVTSGVRQFNRYLSLLGARPVDAKEEPLSSGQQLRRFVMSNEAIREAQAIAAQAAYAGRF